MSSPPHPRKLDSKLRLPFDTPRPRCRPGTNCRARGGGAQRARVLSGAVVNWFQLNLENIPDNTKKYSVNQDNCKSSGGTHSVSQGPRPRRITAHASVYQFQRNTKSESCRKWSGLSFQKRTVSYALEGFPWERIYKWEEQALCIAEMQVPPAAIDLLGILMAAVGESVFEVPDRFLHSRPGLSGQERAVPGEPHRRCVFLLVHL